MLRRSFIQGTEDLAMQSPNLIHVYILDFVTSINPGTSAVIDYNTHSPALRLFDGTKLEEDLHEAGVQFCQEQIDVIAKKEV